MRDKKLQVFVSSTYTDLKEERQAAVEAILSSGNIPAGMELFAAGDESQMTVIKRWIDESDVYLLILGGRYGSVEKHSGKSYTHLEYEYALEQKIPLFAVVITDTALDAKIEVLKRDAIEQENPQKLKEFKTIVLSNVIRFWDDKKDIKIAIHETLADFDHRKDLVGWVRGDKAVDAGPLAEQIAALSKENTELRAKVNLGSNITRYSGLTFEELKQMLEKEFTDGKSTITLFEYLIKNGDKYTSQIHYSAIPEDVKRKLQKYKLIIFGGDAFKFTDEGHKFYLKMLTLKENQLP